MQPTWRGWGWGRFERPAQSRSWHGSLAGDAIDATLTVQAYEATLTRHRKDDLERELPLLVVAQGI